MAIIYPQSHKDSHAEIAEYRGAHNMAEMRRQLDDAEGKVKRQATEIKRLTEALESQKQKVHTARSAHSRLWFSANAALRLLRDQDHLATHDTAEAELEAALSEAKRDHALYVSQLYLDNQRLLLRIGNALAYLNQDAPYLGLILAARRELEQGRDGV